MRLRIHHPLFAAFLGVVGLLVVSVAVFVGSGLRRELIRTFEGELERQAALAVTIVEEVGVSRPDSLTRALTARIGHRVTLIDAAGTVLGDSYVAAERIAGVENHSDRPEVRDALAGGTGFALRESATVGERLLYVAALARPAGRPVVLRIAAPLTHIEETVDRALRTVQVTGLFAMLVALVAAYLLSRGLARPLVELAEQASRMAQGDFSRKMPLGAPVAELEELGSAFNRLTDELRTRLDELGRERDEMQTLIDCMAEGVVALTPDARVLRMNRAARALLGLPGSLPSRPWARSSDTPSCAPRSSAPWSGRRAVRRSSWASGTSCSRRAGSTRGARSPPCSTSPSCAGLSRCGATSWPMRPTSSRRP